MDNFLKHWFGGFEEAINTMDEESRNGILAKCGRACSDSYTRQVFLDAIKCARDDAAFFDSLKKTFSELDIQTIEKGSLYEIRYKFCACDLVKKGFVKTTHLCECSRSSLLYNLESVWGEGNVRVTLVESILAGAPCCRLRVGHRPQESTNA